MSQRDDRGFSLIEVIIAMFLLMVIALALLPLMIGATRTSLVNRDVVAATTLANARLAAVKDAFPLDAASAGGCGDLLTALAAIDPDDANNPGLTVTVTATPEPGDTMVCPPASSAYPRAVLVTAEVSDSFGTLVRIPTRIAVGAP